VHYLDNEGSKAHSEKKLVSYIKEIGLKDVLFGMWGLKGTLEKEEMELKGMLFGRRGLKGVLSRR